MTQSRRVSGEGCGNAETVDYVVAIGLYGDGYGGGEVQGGECVVVSASGPIGCVTYLVGARGVGGDGGGVGAACVRGGEGDGDECGQYIKYMGPGSHSVSGIVTWDLRLAKRKWR